MISNFEQKKNTFNSQALIDVLSISLTFEIVLYTLLHQDFKSNQQCPFFKEVCIIYLLIQIPLFEVEFNRIEIFIGKRRLNQCLSDGYHIVGCIYISVP